MFTYYASLHAFTKRTFTQVSYVFFLALLPSIVPAQIWGDGESLHITPEQVRQQLAWIEENKGGGMAESGISVPIHFYVVHNDQGIPPFMFQSISSSLEYLNSSIGGDVTFYRCKEDHISSADYYSFTLTEADALWNAYHDNNALNVYLVGDINGVTPSFFTYYPTDANAKRMIVIAPITGGLWAPTLLSYAFGTHCGLLPTWFPSTTPNGSCPIDPALPCLGDGICDTPVDPGLTLCTCSNPVYTTTCTDAQGSTHTYTYTPNLFNVMGWHRNCAGTGSFHFTSDQKSIIQSFANSNLNFTPPVCQTEFVADMASIDRFCETTGWEGVRDILIPITNYSFNLTPQNFLTPTSSDDPSNLGDYSLDKHVFTSEDILLLEPIKTDIHANFSIMNPLLGVTSFDLVRISKHILAIEPFTYASQFFAADANYSGTVTTFDIITIRKVILGFETNFPPETGTWRFLPRYYMLSDPDFAFQVFEPINPFAAKWMAGTSNEQVYAAGVNSFMDVLPINLTGNPYVSDPETYSFWAVKTGDVTCDLLPLIGGEDEGESYELIYPAGGALPSGQIFDINVKVGSANPLTAYQIALNFDQSKIQILSPQPGEVSGYNTENFGLTNLVNGKLRALWFKEDGIPYTFGTTEKTIFKLRCRSLAPISNLASVFEIEEEGSFNSGFYNTGGIEVPVQISLQTTPLSNFSSGGSDALFYPGLFESNLNLQVSAKRAGNIKVRFFDFLGHSMLHTFEVTEGVNNFPMEVSGDLHSGIIYYQIEQDGVISAGKLVKQQIR